MSTKNKKKQGEAFSTDTKIIDFVSEPIVLVDSEFNIITTSRSFLGMFRLTRDEALGRKFYDVTGINKKLIERNLLINKLTDEMEAEFECSGLELQALLIRACPVDRNPGADPLLLLAIRDISEQRLEDKAMRMFQFTIDNAPDAVFWMNREAGFSYVNKQACRTLGYTRKELLKLTLADIDPVFQMKRWNAEWSEYQKDGQISMTNVVTFHRRKDGTKVPVEVSAKHICFGGTEFHVAFARDITMRKSVERQLKLTQSAIDRASISCFWIESNSRICYANEQACNSLCYSHEELLNLTIKDIDPYLESEEWANFWEQLSRKKVKTLESKMKRRSGSFFPVEITANYMVFGGTEYCCSYVRDISVHKKAQEEKMALELQLRQAQKMESIGRLAGGIAHEFNNMLSVIHGYVELIKDRMAEDDHSFNDILEIQKATNHSREITRQLLAFSRKQIISPKPVNLNKLILHTRKTLSRLIGENIEFRFDQQENLWTVNLDPVQVDQILVNLAVNSRDAMPHGGELFIKTENVYIDEVDCRENIGFKPGNYVLLTVRDTGMGMDSETMIHLFEPFFTTKEKHNGTGLGLATVYGIVKQNEGLINVYSKPDHGTTFRIHIPKSEEENNREPGLQENISVNRKTGTILLVEDDEMVRKMTTRMLETMGYVVHAAESPLVALDFCKNKKVAIDLLITDVVMPDMSGNELKDRIATLRPGISSLFMSGYTEDVIVQHGILMEGGNFIHKPFRMNELARKIHEAMDGI